VEVENNNENNRKIKIAREKDNEVVRIVKEMKKSGIKILRNEEW